MLKSTLWVGLFLAVGGHQAAAQSLSSLLDRVPADALQQEGERADVLRFVDLQAARQSLDDALAPEQRETLDEFQEQQLLTGRIIWSGVVSEGYLTRAGGMMGHLPDYFGFEWNDIEAIAKVGLPFSGPVILAGRPALSEPVALNAALTTREWDPYEAVERGGSAAWWRFDDGTINPAASDPADLFFGELGGASRIGVVDDVLIGAMDWPTFDAWLASAGGDAPTLSQSSDLSALAAAVERPATAAAVLLQAHMREQPYDIDYLIETGAGESASAEQRSELEAYMAALMASSGTPPYAAVAIADQQNDTTATGIIALSYADRADAEAAAASVPAAVASAVTWRNGRPFAELLPYDVTGDVIEDLEHNRYVARITFSETVSPDSTEPVDFGDGPFRALIMLTDTGDIAGLLATAH